MCRNYAIIVAGGTGSRMGSDTPKQFLLLDGLPVMMHAIRAFCRCNSSPQLIVVIHPTMQNDWQTLCEKHSFSTEHTVVNGGNSRFESVKNGLKAIQSLDADWANSVIAVHDAARPLVPPALIDETYKQAKRNGAAALALRSTDSVRIKSGNGLKNNACPRSHVYLMQTPQAFHGTMLIDAYDRDDDTSFTDDASVVEKKGYPITLVDGDTRNIKITFPEDLSIAKILLQKML